MFSNSRKMIPKKLLGKDSKLNAKIKRVHGQKQGISNSSKALNIFLPESKGYSLSFSDCKHAGTLKLKTISKPLKSSKSNLLPYSLLKTFPTSLFLPSSWISNFLDLSTNSWRRSLQHWLHQKWQFSSYGREKGPFCTSRVSLKTSPYWSYA